MVIVFGVYNLGKSHRVVDRAYCDICGATNRPVVSYSAWEFAHVMFVPVIPLGKNRIFRKCGTCNQHYKIPLKGDKLTMAVDEVRREALATIGGGIDATLAYVAELAHLGDFEGTESVIEALGKQDQAGRALAEARFLSLKGDDKNAEASFRRAAELDQSSGAPNYWFGHFLLSRQRDGEAVEQLRQAAGLCGDYEYADMLSDFHLARKHHKNWDGLATLMAELARLRPDMLEDKSFAKLHAKAHKKTGRVAGSGNPYSQA